MSPLRKRNKNTILYCSFAIALLCIGLVVMSNGLNGNHTASANEKEGDKKAEAKAKPLAKFDTAAGLKVFKKEVRIILAHKCIKCHGGEETEGELDLNTHKGLLAGGDTGDAVVLGKPKESLLYQLITHAEEPAMPEEASKLKDHEIKAIAKWIELGAPYDKPILKADEAGKPWMERVVSADAKKFWSYLPLKKTKLPEVKNHSWCKTPVDRYIIKMLEAKKLTPAKSASRRQLVRRVYLDLIGLPPTPQQIDKFINDKSPTAYDNLIDELLSSKHYGERWARYWLDVARFAESHGFEHDYDRKLAYQYRDFVIKALNQDMPYNQFLQWQLAGDEIEPNNPLALTATGFLGAGVFPTQITANEVERTRYDAMDDMLATTGTAMLGMTIGCAKCHDHKFDAIPQADYYRMLSTFTTTVRSEINLPIKSDGYEQKLKQWQQQQEKLVNARAEYEKKQLATSFAKWEKEKGKKSLGQQWHILKLDSYQSTGGASFKPMPDGSILATGKNPTFDTYVIVAHTKLKKINGIRIEALADKSMVRGGPGRASNGNIALTNFQVTAKPTGTKQKPIELKLTNPQATFEQKGLSFKFSIDNDKKSAWAVDGQIGKNHYGIYETQKSVGYDQGTTLTFILKFENNTGHNIGRPRLAITNSAKPLKVQKQQLPATIVAALNVPQDKRSAKQIASLLTWYRTSDANWNKLNTAVVNHQKQQPKPNKTMRIMLCGEGYKPMRHHTQGADFFKQTFYLTRGDTNQKRGEAKQSFMQALMRSDKKEKQWQVPAPKGARYSNRRLSFARWLTDIDKGAGHLAARVMVNRLWQHHLGRGIVQTPNDFGVQGVRPTHPELLDYLATELIKNGWRLKPIHKLIMKSQVYLQVCEDNAANSKIDPENHYLWRRNRQRLQGEVIRDSILAVSGKLDRTMFGPGTLNEGQLRRSIYFTIKRSKLIPMMQIFDSPEALVSIGSRSSTTVAPQALLLMNNAHIQSYALNFAKEIQAHGKKSPEQAIRRAYLAALGREVTKEELADNLLFLKEQTASYQEKKVQQPELQAYKDICQVLFSLNEFIYVD